MPTPTLTSGAHQVLTGAYDGVACLWDLRSLKSAVASIKAWEGASKKILSVDWVSEVVGVGGEGSVGVWRVGQGDRVLTKECGVDTYIRLKKVCEGRGKEQKGVPDACVMHSGDTLRWMNGREESGWV